MILLVLILVEEDIFKPKLPPPIIKPEVSWVYSMDENCINLALGYDFYHLISAKVEDFRISSLKDRDYSEHYSLSSSISSISYKVLLEHTTWDQKKMTKAESWKWLYYKSNLLLTWVEGVNIEDSLFYGGGIRYYHSFPPLWVGCWLNHLNTPDYGVIITHKGYRIEFGMKRRYVGYTGDLGNIKIGRFRDRFPTVFFPIEKAYPKYLEFYGAEINLLNLTMTLGRRDFYTEGSDTLRWKEGECYFIDTRMEWNRFGFLFSYQNEGIVKNYGKAYLRGNVDWLGYELSLTGLSQPKKYLTCGVSLWLDNEFSPLIAVRNISYSSSLELLSPTYYIGIHYAY